MSDLALCASVALSVQWDYSKVLLCHWEELLHTEPLAQCMACREPWTHPQHHYPQPCGIHLLMSAMDFLFSWDMESLRRVRSWSHPVNIEAGYAERVFVLWKRPDRPSWLGGCISPDLSFPRPRFDNCVFPQWTEASINVTLMNLIPAVLFNSCLASLWHWPSLSNLHKISWQSNQPAVLLG
jgi:hypothetical protein